MASLFSWLTRQLCLLFAPVLLCMLIVLTTARADTPPPTPNQKQVIDLETDAGKAQELYDKHEKAFKTFKPWDDLVVDEVTDKTSSKIQAKVTEFTALKPAYNNASALNTTFITNFNKNNLDTQRTAVKQLTDAQLENSATYIEKRNTLTGKTAADKGTVGTLIDNADTLARKPDSKYNKYLLKHKPIITDFSKLLTPATSATNLMLVEFNNTQKALNEALPAAEPDREQKARAILLQQLPKYRTRLEWMIALEPAYDNVLKAVPENYGAPRAKLVKGREDTKAKCKELQKDLVPLLELLERLTEDQQEDLLAAMRHIYQQRVRGATVLSSVSETRALLKDLNTLAGEWPKIEGSLKTLGLTSPQTADIRFLFAMLRDSADLLTVSLSATDDNLTGGNDDFISDQVRLYYYTDVPRLIKALNPKADLVPVSKEDYQKKYQELRDNLVKQESKKLGAMSEIDAKRARMLEIREEIRQVTARANQANHDVTIVKQQQSKLVKDKKGQQEALDQADPESDEYVRLTKEMSKLDERLTAQNQVVADTEAEKTAADAEQDKLRNEQEGLPHELEEARKVYTDAQKELLKLRIEAAKIAPQEAEAFAETRDNAPYWYANANALSIDPACRVILHAYPDSKTIFLRGMPADVEKVKQMIAAFDRPAPQARITLWTMQINAVNGKRSDRSMNTALAGVDDALRSYRSNVALTQEILRDSIIAEVSRVMDVTKLATSKALSERMARYYIYPDELRKQLGFPGTLPNLVEYPAIVRKELDLASEYFMKSRQIIQILTDEQWPIQEKEQKIGECLFYITKMTEHLNQACTYWESYYGSMKRSTDPALTTDTVKTALTYCDTMMTGIRKEVERISRAQKAGTLRRDFLKMFTPAKSHDIAWQLEIYLNTDPLPTSVPALPSGQPRQDTTFSKTREQLTVLLDASRNYIKNRPVTEYERFFTTHEQQEIFYITQLTLPDPTQVTTLGEMLFVLSLTERGSRERILKNFLDEVNVRYLTNKLTPDQDFITFSQGIARQTGNSGLLLPQTVRTWAQIPSKPEERSDPRYPLFPRFLLGSTPGRVAGETEDWELNANQKEIAAAIRTKAREAVANEIISLIGQIRSLPADDKLSENLRDRYLPLLGWLTQDSYLNTALRLRLGNSSIPDYTKIGLLVMTKNITLPTTPDALSRLDENALGIARLEKQNNSLARATPRVAAADEMLKRFIQIAEDDLDYFFFQPAQEQIVKSCNGSGIQLGVIQRESMLVTNRMVARMDPNASASLEMEPGTDFLQAATQLGELGMRYAESKRYVNQVKMTDTAPLLGALGATQLAEHSTESMLGIGAGISLLGAMAAQPQQQAGEEYAINNGDLFKITPIFDPSGQALRFKFDYAATVRIQEPQGSQNTLLPRVDRHTINTEVQLGNLELREVTRFTTNTRIGVPERRVGGIPILKEVPYLNELPIVGYYYRQKGSKEAYQESVIFAQTSIYPTVADIIDLMVDAQRQPVTAAP